MNLYNALKGHNPNTEQLFELLQLSPGDFGRYSNVYVKDGCIVVHTRCGGGNREDYEEVFEMSETHPWYSHNEDCDYDSTYADIYFRIPNDETASVVGLLDPGEDPAVSWERFLGKLRK